MKYEVTLLVRAVVQADDPEGAASQAQRQLGLKGGYTYQVRDIASGSHFDVVTESDPEPEPESEAPPEAPAPRANWWKRP